TRGDDAHQPTTPPGAPGRSAFGSRPRTALYRHARGRERRSATRQLPLQERQVRGELAQRLLVRLVDLRVGHGHADVAVRRVLDVGDLAADVEVALLEDLDLEPERHRRAVREQLAGLDRRHAVLLARPQEGDLAAVDVAHRPDERLLAAEVTLQHL